MLKSQDMSNRLLIRAARIVLATRSSSVRPLNTFVPKQQRMKSVLSFLGLSTSRTMASSGKTKEELQDKAQNDPKNMSAEEWHDLLDGPSYYVTREHGTERPWSSCLNDEKRSGTFYCVCCNNPLFESKTVRISSAKLILSHKQYFLSRNTSLDPAGRPSSIQ